MGRKRKGNTAKSMPGGLRIPIVLQFLVPVPSGKLSVHLPMCSISTNVFSQTDFCFLYLLLQWFSITQKELTNMVSRLTYVC